jgi:hypothetical protein
MIPPLAERLEAFAKKCDYAASLFQHSGTQHEADDQREYAKTLREAATALSQPSDPEVCICAAIRLNDGEVFRGHRHDDAIRTAGNAGVERERIWNAAQGFMTSRGRFVGREEGARLQREAGVLSAQTQRLPEGMLFSEDLYLRSTKGMSIPRPPGLADPPPGEPTP